MSATATAERTRSHYETLFTVTFHVAMTDALLDRLANRLGMAMHLHPKLFASPVSPAVARLDLTSGLFLVPGEGEDEWRLEARTWARPPYQARPSEEAIARWHRFATAAVHPIDPSVDEEVG